VAWSSLFNAVIRTVQLEANLRPFNDVCTQMIFRIKSSYLYSFITPSRPYLWKLFCGVGDRPSIQALARRAWQNIDIYVPETFVLCQGDKIERNFALWDNFSNHFGGFLGDFSNHFNDFLPFNNFIQIHVRTSSLFLEYSLLFMQTSKS
jgi:hypothetical protein